MVYHTSAPHFTVQVNRTITPERIADLLACAFDSGSAYWASINNLIEPDVWDFRSGGKDGQKYATDYPVNFGGAVVIGDGEKEYCIDEHAIRAGLQAMATKFPSHWADFIEENEDATTGDVFLQCCCFGTVIYG